MCVRVREEGRGEGERVTVSVLRLQQHKADQTMLRAAAKDEAN